MDDEAESVVEGTIGLDPNKTVLWAQVREGQPQMSIDIEGRLRPAGIKGNSTVYLGDVARAALRSLGPADSPFFESIPGYDEQRWRFSTSDSLLPTISIASDVQKLACARDKTIRWCEEWDT